jgi:hypothetical protein
MLQGMDINQRVEFTSSADKTTPKTKFILKPLTASEMLETTKYVQGGKLELNQDYVMDLLDKSIVEIKNPDIKEKDKINAFINSLTPVILVELINKVTSLNRLSEDEEKNS